MLSIFENAASGWSGKEVGEEQGVDRKDWRAVCAILFADPRDTGIPSDNPLTSEGEDEEDVEEADEDSDDDVYESDQEDEDEDGSDYGKPGPSKRSTRKTRQTKSGVDSDDDRPQGPQPLSQRQRRECRRTYALFFPDVPSEDLPKQRLLLKDLARVARSVNEKLTTEEVSLLYR